jgi:uncharacterized protein (DUF885 family)
MPRNALPFALVAAAVTLFPEAPLAAQVNQNAATIVSSSADRRLQNLYNSEWEWRLKEFARLRGTGPGALEARLPRVDAAAQRARLTYWTKVLATLDQIPISELSDEEKINAAVFRASILGMVDDIRFKNYEAPFNADTFFWASIAPRGGFANAEEYRRYIGRIRDVPRYFSEHIANMRAGLKRGFSVPRVAVTGRDKTIEPYLREDDTNPLFGPLKRMPPNIAEAERDQLRQETAAAIREAAVPAYANLLTMIRSEYLPKARTTIGASELPDGDAYYQAMINKFTTLDLTAQQIHDTGLKEVARIRAEMEVTKAKTGFAGTLADFMAFLKTDPQFYAKTPRELLSYSSYVAKRADGRMAETIGTLPRYRHGIIAVPADLAPIYTGGRGGLDNCMMNTYNLPARPLYTLPALTLHECTPGHSFQAALALEGPDRPDFRKEIYFSGYGEGWGLYTEWLGTVMGIYETPYEDFGRLTYEMWRAARLVIDTGIHKFGWSRDRAIDFLKSNTALSDHEITTEVDRYIAWPGQAVSYKLGEIQIRRHRAEAEAALGDKFDQRYFHDAILQLGAVPLPVLETRIRKFIADGGRNPDAAR